MLLRMALIHSLSFVLALNGINGKYLLLRNSQAFNYKARNIAET